MDEYNLVKLSKSELTSNKTDIQKLFQMMETHWYVFINSDIKSNTSEYCNYGEEVGNFTHMVDFYDLLDILNFEENMNEVQTNDNKAIAVRITKNQEMPNYYQEGVSGCRITSTIGNEYFNSLLLQIVSNVLCKNMKSSSLIVCFIWLCI